MRKDQLTSRLVLLELLGFAFLILWVWMDEVLDLPHHLFGAEPSSVNFTEAIEETTVFLVVGSIIILLSRSLLLRLKYLEGFLPVCSFCKQIRVGERWIPLERYVTENSDAVFSHSFCPACAQKHYGVGEGNHS